MSIKEIKNEFGKSYFDVSVCQRSKLNPKIKIQRRVTNITGIQQAKRAEKALTRQAIEEVLRREQLGESWGYLLDQWELAMRDNIGFPRTLTETSKQDMVGTLRKYTSHWEHRPAKAITPLDVEEVYDQARNDGKSTARIKTIRSALNCLFNWAIKCGAIPNIERSPA